MTLVQFSAPFVLSHLVRAAGSNSAIMQRSRRNVPQNSKQGALAQLRAIKSGDAKRSDQFEVRLPLIAPSAVIAEAIVPGVGSPWLWCLCSSKQRAISTRTWERMSTRRL